MLIKNEIFLTISSFVVLMLKIIFLISVLIREFHEDYGDGCRRKESSESCKCEKGYRFVKLSYQTLRGLIRTPSNQNICIFIVCVSLQFAFLQNTGLGLSPVMNQTSEGSPVVDEHFSIVIALLS